MGTDPNRGAGYMPAPVDNAPVLTLDDNQSIDLRIGVDGHVVRVLAERDGDGNLYVRLDPQGCNLEGEEPGMYYLAPRTEREFDPIRDAPPFD